MSYVNIDGEISAFFFFIVSVLISKGQWIISQPLLLVITMCNNAHFYLQVADLLKSASNSLDIFVDTTAHIKKSESAAWSSN